MQLTENELILGDDVNGVAAGVGEEGGYVEAANSNVNVGIEAKETSLSLSATYILTERPAPLQITASELSLIGIDSQVGSNTPSFGSACPASGAPVWVKLNVNGVLGVVPFFPLPE